MQAKYLINLSPDFQQLPQQGAAGLDLLITGAVDAHAAQIGYLLQDYYQKERVREVSVLPGSLEWSGPTAAGLILQYRIEAFNVCSAIDTEAAEKMRFSAVLDFEKKELLLTGENWPERNGE